MTTSRGRCAPVHSSHAPRHVLTNIPAELDPPQPVAVQVLPADQQADHGAGQGQLLGGGLLAGRGHEASASPHEGGCGQGRGRRRRRAREGGDGLARRGRGAGIARERSGPRSDAFAARAFAVHVWPGLRTGPLPHLSPHPPVIFHIPIVNFEQPQSAPCGCFRRPNEPNVMRLRFFSFHVAIVSFFIVSVNMFAPPMYVYQWLSPKSLCKVCRTFLYIFAVISTRSRNVFPCQSSSNLLFTAVQFC